HRRAAAHPARRTSRGNPWPRPHISASPPPERAAPTARGRDREPRVDARRNRERSAHLARIIVHGLRPRLR
ncbi:hypothetical protein ACFV4N_43150, partial [Actinosynnema sp. NPDC059797]